MEEMYSALPWLSQLLASEPASVPVYEYKLLAWILPICFKQRQSREKYFLEAGERGLEDV